jgi:hypothetical protein
VENNVFRALFGAGAWTIFGIYMTSRPSADTVVNHALLVGSVGVYAVCVWKLLSRRDPPNIQSGSKHDAYKRLHQ